VALTRHRDLGNLNSHLTVLVQPFRDKPVWITADSYCVSCQRMFFVWSLAVLYHSPRPVKLP
jgi:hypothetical protein